MFNIRLVHTSLKIAWTGKNDGDGRDFDPSVFAQNTTKLLLEHESVIAFAGENKTSLQCDGAWSDKPNHALFMTVGDCFPIVLWNEKTSVFSLVHGGWRSLQRGILENACKLLSPTHAWIGFGLRSCCNTASDNAFAGNPTLAQYVTKERQGYRYDLVSYIKDVLTSYNVDTVNLNICTYCTESDYFSHRRSVHQKQKQDPRHLIAVWREV